MKIQYYHNRPRGIRVEFGELIIDDFPTARGGTTIAMEEIPVDMFNEMTPDHTLECFVGKAKCSNKDNYNKKTGRNIAVGRMKEIALSVLAVSTNENGTREVVLQDGTGSQYTLIHKEGTNTVRFIDYEN